MKFFLDTANVDEITELASTGLVDGITTNPSLIAASGRNMIEVIKEITGLVDGPVSAEVTQQIIHNVSRRQASKRNCKKCCCESSTHF